MRLFEDGSSPGLIGGVALDGDLAAADAHDVMVTVLFNDLGFAILAVLLVYLLILFFLHFLGIVVLSLLSIVVTVLHFV